MDNQEINDVAKIFGHLIRSHLSNVKRVLEEEGLCPSQPGIIHVLSQCHQATQVELANKLNVTPATISAMLKRMERDGLIERQRSLTDQRVTYVCLTESGIEQAKVVNEIFRELNFRAFGNFSKDEIDQAKFIFRKLLENLQD